MKTDTAMFLGFVLGLILAVIVCASVYEPIADCYHSYTDNNPPVVLTNPENGYCYTIQEVNGIEVQLSLSDYRKLQKVVGK